MMNLMMKIKIAIIQPISKLAKLKQEMSAPTSSKDTIPSMKPNQSMSTTVRPAKFILRPAKFLMKPAIEETRKRLCSSEEVEAKKQQAVETRKRSP